MIPATEWHSQVEESVTSDRGTTFQVHPKGQGLGPITMWSAEVSLNQLFYEEMLAEHVFTIIAALVYEVLCMGGAPLRPL